MICHLGNILEHVISPIDLLNKCYKLLSRTGIYKSFNDFSRLQKHVTQNNPKNFTGYTLQTTFHILILIVYQIY